MTNTSRALEKQMLLGRYRVVRLLGEGGMGTVHLARVEGAEGFTLPVVVKRMRRELRATDEGNRFFIREAKILAKMQHPAIVGISDFGVDDGAHIMVLQYVHGYPLSSWIDYREVLKSSLPVDICLYIVRQVLDALHYAHHFDTEEGQEIEIVHRDIAPDNVLVSSRGYVRLLDFGVASMKGPQASNSTKEGAFRGKLGYAAPETIQGHAATPRSDQYSAAVVLLELLTHVTPFLSDSMGETVVRMVNEIPPAPSSVRNDIPAGLDQALARALEKQPQARFEDALEFSRQLRMFQQEDDEEIARQLKQLVRTDFELLPETIDVEALKLREEALARVDSIPSQVAAAVSDTLPAPKGEEPNDKASSSIRAVASVRPAVAEVPKAPRNSLRGILWSLVVVGALIATGLGATVSFLARNTGSLEQQVVVIGSDRSESSGMANPALQAPDQKTKKAEAAVEQGEKAPSPDRGNVRKSSTAKSERSSKSRSKTKSNPKTKTRKNPGGLQQRLAAAVQQQAVSYESCFTKYIAGGGAYQKAILHFSVARAGGSPQVEVEPPALAGTSLGGCLSRIARKVRFPKLKKPVAFRVPVLARVSRTKVSK